ncbi:hypothetical protein RvVAT039_pl02960 (plasmid) [Agrobacterium vitis]|nr:hypothetical protein RvVAT039_pl02960 [Agrobacterium vitis]
MLDSAKRGREIDTGECLAPVKLFAISVIAPVIVLGETRLLIYSPAE